MQYNLGLLHEVIAQAVPDRECLVFRDRRFSWRQVADRTRRLASVLRANGLGCHRKRSSLENWESGQDHVALYMHNCNEYLEGMLGAFKARCAPFNVNYRYVEEELLYLFDNADAKAVVYHATFAPVLEKIRPKLSQVELWLQVQDDSGHTLLPGALEYERALADAEPAEPEGLSPDDLYILYTGGTTGMPKGVLWRQEDIFRAALAAGGVPASTFELQERVRSRPGPKTLPTPPFMHGAAHWAAFNIWHTGGTIFVQSRVDRLDPDDIWSLVQREKLNTMLIVGDAFARPLLDQLDEQEYDLSSLGLVTTGGAILTAALKQELLQKLPHVKILDALGSSETGSQATHMSASDGKTKAKTGSFAMAPDNVVLKQDLSGVVEPGSGESGWLARCGSVPLGYYKDAEKTARTFPVVGGVRYSVPGDRALVEADGSLKLLGRDSVTINSGGEKIFAEEVEHALKHHPAVYDAVVVGTPSERWGQQVTAIIQLRTGQKPEESDLKHVAGEHIASYKLPKAFVYVEQMIRAPSGKADYRWAKQAALAALDLEDPRAKGDG